MCQICTFGALQLSCNVLWRIIHCYVDLNLLKLSWCMYDACTPRKYFFKIFLVISEAKLQVIPQSVSIKDQGWIFLEVKWDLKINMYWTSKKDNTLVCGWRDESATDIIIPTVPMAQPGWGKIFMVPTEICL